MLSIFVSPEIDTCYTYLTWYLLNRANIGMEEKKTQNAGCVNVYQLCFDDAKASTPWTTNVIPTKP